MTEKQLKQFGFKQKGSRKDGYWFELNSRNHKFITCDNFFNKGKDEWNIGYQHKKHDPEIFWFNNNLKSHHAFIWIYGTLTKKRLKYTQVLHHLQTKK